jgi:spectinomycin phosphotransferase
VRDRPTGITERDVVRALADGWGLLAGEPRYTPAGGGSYHWMVTADQGDQWFVTVDDLDGKGWLGRTRPAAFAGLRTAMEAAVTLRDQAALAFVVAPVPALDGQAVRPLGDRHAMTVFPFLPGTPGRWDEGWPAADRAELVTMLAALHGADPAAAPLRRPGFGLSWRDALERALSELGRPWTGGPIDLRAPHRRTPGTEHAWRALEISIAKLNR